MITDISTIEERNAQKKESEFLRESGNVEEALERFELILEWDKINSNFRGYVDILGHISICLKLLAEKETEIERKKDLYSKVLEILIESVEKAKEYQLPIGSISIQQVHLSSAFLAHSEYFEGEAKKAQLLTALDTIESAIENLPGSKAHKSWPLNIKAQILYELNQYEEAFLTSLEGIKFLHLGYEDQIKEDDNSDVKIKIWLTGLFITLAKISKAKNNIILSSFFANSVMTFSMSDKFLERRRAEADKILNG